jgi:hypothetical protein
MRLHGDDCEADATPRRSALRPGADRSSTPPHRGRCGALDHSALNAFATGVPLAVAAGYQTALRGEQGGQPP